MARANCHHIPALRSNIISFKAGKYSVADEERAVVISCVMANPMTAEDVLPLVRAGVPKNNVNTARKIVFVCAVLSLILAAVARANPSIGLGIVELTVFAGALYAAAFLPGLLGILYWKNSTAVGVILGMLAGAISTAVWKFVVMITVPALSQVPEVFIGVLFGTAAFVLGSLYGRRDSANLPS